MSNWYSMLTARSADLETASYLSCRPVVGKVASCSTCNYYSLFTNGNFLLTTRSADLANCLMSSCLAWMVGKFFVLVLYM